MAALKRRNLNSIPDDILRNAGIIFDCTSVRPRFGMILGSGLSGAAEAVEKESFFPYESLYVFSSTTVEGHPGVLVTGEISGTPVAVFRGRSHLYEGVSHDNLVSQVRLSYALGVDCIIITNAAGALAGHFRAGDFMPFVSHLNFMHGATNKDIAGISLKCNIYDPSLVDCFIEAARQCGTRAFPGVYAAMTGPNYETPAEAEALRRFGADAVGMSTVPETIEALRLGMKVLAVSCITNDAAPVEGASGPSHSEVLKAGMKSARSLAEILKQLFANDII